MTSHWWYVFCILSVKVLRPFWSELGQYAEPSDDVQIIAKSFVSSYYMWLNHGKVVPETPSIQLISDYSDENILETLWHNTFSHLNEIGYADKIYYWGKRRFFTNFERFHSQISHSSNWNLILTRWLEQPDSPLYTPFPLSSQSQENLRNIIVRYETRYSQIESLYKRLLESEKNIWDTFAFDKLGFKASIKLQLKFRSWLILWDEVYMYLSSEDIELLNQWGADCFVKWGWKPVPIEKIDFQE